MPELHLNLFELIIAFGIFQSLILVGVLLLRKENIQANALLALLLFSLSYSSVVFLVLVFQLFNKYPLLHLLPYGLGFVIGPAFYFYTRSLVMPQFKFRARHLWHFTPIILQYPHSIYHLVYGREIPHLKWHYFLDNLGALALVPIAIYLFFSYKLIRQYQQDIADQLSNTDKITLKWLRHFLVGLTILTCIMLIYTLINLLVKDLNFNEEYWAYLLLTAAVTYLGFGGLNQVQNSYDPASLSNNAGDGPTLEVGNWKAEHVSLLKRSMEKDQLYLNPDLNIRMLEDHIQLSAKNISTALNQGLHVNFYQFVNAYRIEEVKKRLLAPQYQHLTIMGIAQEAGFRSKATFNRIFKETTGKTPKQFRLTNEE